MSNLVICLILWCPQVEEQPAAVDTTFVTVGDRRAISNAASTTDDRVRDDGCVGEGRFEVEVQVGARGRGHEDVVGQSVRRRSTELIAGTSHKVGRCGENGGREEKGGERCETHVRFLWLGLNGLL